MGLIAKFTDALVSRGRRSIKALGLGYSSASTAFLAQPFGEDTHPAAAQALGWKAVFMDTANDGEPVCVGFINPTAAAAVGEKRLFSVNGDGEEQFYILLKSNGTAELGGVADNAVRYSALSTGLVNQDSAINAELVKIATAIAGVGGAYTPATVTTNISASKIDEIKTP